MTEKDQKTLIAKIGSIEAHMAAIDAKLDALNSRNRDEIDALFESRKEHEKRISNVERDYVSENNCRHQRENLNRELQQSREETVRAITELRAVVSHLDRKVYYTCGAFAVLVIVIQVAMRGLFHL